MTKIKAPKSISYSPIEAEVAKNIMLDFMKFIDGIEKDFPGFSEKYKEKLLHECMKLVTANVALAESMKLNHEGEQE